jgi:predicted flavoprotein YhiN
MNIMSDESINNNEQEIDTIMNVNDNKSNNYLLSMKKNMRERINNLSRNEKIEIFKLIYNNKQKYSENKSGIMFNLSQVNQEIIDKINDFLQFSDLNNTELNQKEDYYDKLKEKIN